MSELNTMIENVERFMKAQNDMNEIINGTFEGQNDAFRQLRARILKLEKGIFVMGLGLAFVSLGLLIHMFKGLI